MTSIPLPRETGALSHHAGFLAQLASGPSPVERLRLLGGSADIVSDGERTLFLAGVLYDGSRPIGAGRAATAALEAYRRYGTGIGNHLEGTFSLVVWDPAVETLLCVRDPLGAMPLFYAPAGDDLLVSTSLDELVGHPKVSAELSRAALADHLCHRWPDKGETYYASIRRVPPGHFMQVGSAGRNVSRYWHPVTPGQPVNWVQKDELAQFEGLFDQAIGRSLALGPSGMFLSGGLDSVSVAAFAVDRCKREGLPPPVALSLAFPTAEANEELVQRSVAADLGLEHVMVDFDEAIGPQGLVRAALETSSELSAPLMNVWFPAYRRLRAEGAARGCRVVMTGGGGDEWLGVSPFLAADLMRQGNVLGLFGLWRAMTRSYRLPPVTTLKRVLWTFGSKQLAAAAAERWTPQALAAYRRRTQKGLTPDWVAPEQELRDEILERAVAVSSRAPGGFYLREVQLTLDHALVSLEMEELHESGIRTGVPLRMPYWDAQVVDFLYRTPPELLNEGGRSKGLVRQILARKFPAVGFERQRKVLATNFFTGRMSHELPRVWREMDGTAALEALGIVDGARLHSTVREMFERMTDQGAFRVWSLLTLESWVRSHMEQGGR